MAFTVRLFLLSSLLLLPTYVLAQTNGSIAVGASLSTAGNSSWLSPSGDFAFGFRQLENNDLFLLSIWFVKIPDKTIVWYANGDKPAPDGSVVNLTANSGLVLTSPQGEQLWKSNQTIAGVVAHGVMNDTGNFVLENEQSAKLWETFKNPTDTMLPGQILERGWKLSSRNSETNYTRGHFQLDFQDDGNLVLSGQKPYYSTGTTTGSVPDSEGKQLVFNESGDFYILRKNGGYYKFTAEERVARDYYLRTTLSFDGVLAQYFLPKTSVGNISWVPLWSEPSNICQKINVDSGPSICGYNSICTYKADKRPTCECPTGYSLLDPNDPYGSCNPAFKQVCENKTSYAEDLYDVQVLANTDWLTSSYMQLNDSTADNCSQSCKQDCSCAVAIYSNQTCQKKKFPLSYGREDNSLNATTFIKLTTVKKKKNGSTSVHVGSVLLGIFVFVSFMLGTAVCLGLFFSFRKKHARFPQNVCLGLFFSFRKKHARFPQNDLDTNLRSFSHKELEEATNSMASSSSSSARRWKYDVFLSFRGPDTRKGITFDIYDRLKRSGIKTFMDRDLEVGNVISLALLTSIRESKFAIVVLSQNYCSSSWCLEELREICLSMEDSRILPLFYDVDPTDVRYQKKSFEDAFSKHETSERHESEKVKQWRAALNKVANISGWNTNDYKTHKELVDVIVESLRSKVPPDAIESTGDFQEYEATRQAMDEVKKALTDDEITAVGVYGMGGVGKTSMVRHVAAQACKNGTFNHWIMAAISQSPDYRKIQGTLADLLGVKLEGETEIGRAARLLSEIRRREKLLIILDDVWNRTELSTIGIPSYEELQKCRSKVLLTTRRRNVCHVMKCQASIPLNILSEQDSWTLFVRNARSFEWTTFVGVARKVAGECRGLPIALIAVARALGDKDEAEWHKAARRLEKSQSATVEDEQDLFKCIKLSYDYLKDEDSKSCFLLCCLYPEDHDIRLESLFKYAIGTGLFRRDAETIEEARGTADSVVKYLKDSSLLLEGYDKGFVKMHDVIRDTALNIAKSKDGHGFLVKAGCGLKVWPCGSHQGYSAISLMRNEIRKLPDEELVCPDLQILLLKRNADLDEIPEKFIQSLNELRVLDLSNTSISSLPQSFSLLTSLQALYLDFCKKLIDISIVGKLKKLEILSMREYPGEELSREIGHLTNLRILDVSASWDGGEVTIPSKVISKLHKLEELYILNCGFEDWGSKVQRELDFAGLSRLKILQVCISDANCIPKNVVVKPDWDYFDILIGSFKVPILNRYDYKSRSLLLGSTISALPDWFINGVTEKTEKLEYECCEGMSDILMEYDNGRLHKLKHLKVNGYFLDLGPVLLMNTTRRVQEGPVFEELEELHLISLIHLEELCVGELPPGSLINLKVFYVVSCPNLGNVSKFVQRLPNLEKLYLNGMSKLEYVFKCEGFKPKQSKLREMHLLGRNSVKNICSGPAPCVMFQSLKCLNFYRCKLLQSLFASDVAKCLFQLEDLFVEQCPLLERVIEAVNNEKTILPKLKNLVLMGLPMLYGASGTIDIECPSLEHLIVGNCPQFSFSTSFEDLFDLESGNRFSFSTSASNYFGSTNPVQLNDPQLYRFLLERIFHGGDATVYCIPSWEIS